ncbi:MAG: UvrD-helicase domain-containing protein, partial [Clostridia bacterium]|nr:UvrD-helicase domain-containing protein [Clostridia bacterium]
MAARSWTTEQRHCIDDRGGTLLVSAAAGSGKTSVLVERLIGRITDPVSPTDLDRLLVVTFTKAAAAEMKQRIAAELTKRIAADPQNLHLQRQQLALPRAAISTVDSFCTNLLRDNSYLLNISPRFKVAEEQQLLLLRHEALTETLNECYREKSADFLELAAMLTNGKNDKLLLSTVEKLYTFIQSHPYPEEWLTETQAIYDDTLPLGDTIWGKLVRTQIEDELQKCLNLCRCAASLCQNDTQLCANYLPALQLDAHILKDLLEQVRGSFAWDTVFSQLSALTPSKVKTIRNCADESAKQRVSALRDEMRAQMKGLSKLYLGTEEQCRGDLRDTRRLIAALYDVVRRFSLRFSDKKAAQQYLDFNDIEHYALELLTTTDDAGNHVPSAFARELSSQYDEIMVDEYQDTNATQDALFSALSKNESNLFYVGDVKQSIYGFRQAMPELFVRRRTTYAPYTAGTHPAVIVLGNNFRSRLQVTDSVNFLFRQLMTEQVGGIPYTKEEELVCSAAYTEAAEHETECLIVDGDQAKQYGLDKDVAEARVIAARIRDLRGNLPITENGDTRPADYGDFCILLRSKKGHAVAYRDELERLGIPVSLDSDNGFFDTAEIRLAVSLLRCIDNPTLDVSLTAVMLSPLFGFSPDDLAHIHLLRPSACLYTGVCAMRHNPDHPELAVLCERFIAQIEQYRTLAATLTVDALLRRLYEDTALPEIMMTRVGGAARRENLQALH